MHNLSTYWEVHYTANTTASRQTIFTTVLDAVKEVHKLNLMGIYAEVRPLKVTLAEPGQVLEMEEA